MMPSPDEIQRIVTLAFAIEAISEKDECTTRFVDLPGKPLEDFLVAGVNVGRHFRLFAEDIQRTGWETEVFYRMGDALHDANRNKSKKFVNFGLLEAMFPVVYARCLSASSEDAIAILWNVLNKKNSQEVQHLLNARKIAWATSENVIKKNFPFQKYEGMQSAAEFYLKLIDDYQPSHSNNQWAQHAVDGFPILRRTYAALKQRNDILEIIPIIHRQLRKELPEIKIGILADYCAAAIFLYLYDEAMDSVAHIEFVGSLRSQG